MKYRGEKIFLLLLAALLLTVATACDPKVDIAEIEQKITVGINTFKTAVEEYHVEGMLGFLAPDNFRLTIKEAGLNLQEDKDYETLAGELREDEEKQLRWRKSPPLGNGYQLTMELGSITFSNTDANGSFAIVAFTIYEKAEDPAIEEQITDIGSLACAMVKEEGEWLCREMTINFESMDGQLLQTVPFGRDKDYNVSVLAALGGKGFALGSLIFE